MTLHIAVPIRPGDVELYGEDPYRSAQNWHQAWHKTLGVIEAARGVIARSEDLELNNGEAEELGLDLLREALDALDSRGGSPT